MTQPCECLGFSEDHRSLHLPPGDVQFPGPSPSLLLHCSSVAFNLNTQNAPNWEGLQQHLRCSLGPSRVLSLLISVIFIPIGRGFSCTVLGFSTSIPIPLCVNMSIQYVPVCSSLVSGLILTPFQRGFELDQSWVLKQAVSSGVQPSKQPSPLLFLHFHHHFSCAWI